MAAGNGRRAVNAAALLGCLTVTLVAREASAFCRTTTCDPRKESCRKNGDNCIVDGVPLAWPDQCLSFGTQEDASVRRHIDYLVADRVFQNAFKQWAGVSCGGRPPSFRMWDLGDAYGGIVCNEPEFNKSSPNASVWMFRDDDWPYDNEDATLAMTTVQFEKSTGVILDADVEVNSFNANLTTSSVAGHIQADLQSIATHEAGHFLGLSHSTDAKATMYARYRPETLDIRSLEPDDVRGICAAYPPDRDAPDCDRPVPPHGFSRYCGGEPDTDGAQRIRACAVEAPTPSSSYGIFALAVGALLVGVRRRAFLARSRPLG